MLSPPPTCTCRYKCRSWKIKKKVMHVLCLVLDQKPVWKFVCPWKLPFTTMTMSTSLLLKCIVQVYILVYTLYMYTSCTYHVHSVPACAYTTSHPCSLVHTVPQRNIAYTYMYMYTYMYASIVYEKPSCPSQGGPKQSGREPTSLHLSSSFHYTRNHFGSLIVPFQVSNILTPFGTNLVIVVPCM